MSQDTIYMLSELYKERAGETTDYDYDVTLGRCDAATATGEIQHSRKQRAKGAEQRGGRAALGAAWCKHRQPEAEPAHGTTPAVGFERPGGLVVGRPSF
ncbi:hypothetical protein NDU88_007323 [Pleurodeles waltl]|uniref:Uncharacterized protein n=1 Tax=Pleurodeles waltl TaxID=8319 RepID=A0AAV7N1S4_PLEWA|nr:hypothetical protein NDU88_007323 [Pleurodeles waltl]